MEVWYWVLVYVAVLVLAQVLVYLYLRDGDEDGQFVLSDDGERGAHTRPNGIPGQPLSHPRQHRRETDDGTDTAEELHADSPGHDLITCPHCGVRNEREQIYTYCRNCTTQLGH